MVMKGFTFQPKINYKGVLILMFISDGHSIMAECNFYEM